MPLTGKQVMPREIAEIGAPHWKGVELLKMIATTLSESQGYLGAWNDNVDSDGNVKTRDLGLMQINRPGSIIDTPEEFELRTDSKVRSIWLPVAQANATTARALYISPGDNSGQRRWQPWVGYTSGWAMFNGWFTWRHENGKPMGPWIRSGRYLHRAIPGLANYRILIKKDNTAEEALEMARGFARRFKIDGTLGIAKDGTVKWQVIPKMPTAAPADGHGPRPVPNKGA